MRVLVATAMYPTPERPAFGSFVRTQVESLRRIGVDAEPFVLAGRRRKLIYPKGMYGLRRRIASAPFDVVHAHYSYVGIVARTQHALPVIVTYHGDDLLGTVDERGKTIPLSRPIVAAGRLLARLVDAVIVQSAEMAARVPRPDVHVIPHEVDFEVFRPVQREVARRVLGLDPDKRYVLFASPPHIPVKRYPLAVEAVARLGASHGPVELCVVHAETQDRLALYMSACDALVFPSFQEGSPNIVKQAMACNLPIVATDVGDAREIVGETRGCFICAPDPDAFAERLAQIIAWRGRTTGRSKIRHLDGARIAARVVAVYDEVLDRGRARALKPRRAASGG